MSGSAVGLKTLLEQIWRDELVSGSGSSILLANHQGRLCRLPGRPCAYGLGARQRYRPAQHVEHGRRADAAERLAHDPSRRHLSRRWSATVGLKNSSATQLSCACQDDGGRITNFFSGMKLSSSSVFTDIDKPWLRPSSSTGQVRNGLPHQPQRGLTADAFVERLAYPLLSCHEKYRGPGSIWIPLRHLVHIRPSHWHDRLSA